MFHIFFREFGRFLISIQLYIGRAREDARETSPEIMPSERNTIQQFLHFKEKREFSNWIWKKNFNLSIDGGGGEGRRQCGKMKTCNRLGTSSTQTELKGKRHIRVPFKWNSFIKDFVFVWRSFQFRAIPLLLWECSFVLLLSSALSWGPFSRLPIVFRSTLPAIATEVCQIPDRTL